MSREDAESTGANRLQQGLAIVVAAVVVTVALVAFVRMKSLQVEVGYRVHDLRTELVTLEQEHAALLVEKTALLRPSRLARIARETLQLVPPTFDAATGEVPIATPMESQP